MSDVTFVDVTRTNFLEYLNDKENFILVGYNGDLDSIEKKPKKYEFYDIDENVSKYESICSIIMKVKQEKKLKYSNIKLILDIETVQYLLHSKYAYNKDFCSMKVNRGSTICTKFNHAVILDIDKTFGNSNCLTSEDLVQNFINFIKSLNKDVAIFIVTARKMNNKIKDRDYINLLEESIFTNDVNEKITDTLTDRISEQYNEISGNGNIYNLNKDRSTKWLYYFEIKHDISKVIDFLFRRLFNSVQNIEKNKNFLITHFNKTKNLYLKGTYLSYLPDIADIDSTLVFGKINENLKENLKNICFDLFNNNIDENKINDCLFFAVLFFGIITSFNKQLQINEIHRKTGIPYSNIYFFDDASDNKDAYDVIKDMFKEVGDMKFFGGNDKCVFDQIYKDERFIDIKNKICEN